MAAVAAGSGDSTSPLARRSNSSNLREVFGAPRSPVPRAAQSTSSMAPLQDLTSLVSNITNNMKGAVQESKKGLLEQIELLKKENEFLHKELEQTQGLLQKSRDSTEEANKMVLTTIEKEREKAALEKEELKKMYMNIIQLLSGNKAEPLSQTQENK